MNSKSKNDFEYKRSKFRIALLAIMLFLIAIRFVDLFIYPDTDILPANFFFAVAIVQLFFLWFDEVKEKYHILWVQKKKDELNEMKSKFMLITSHELLTPIAVIKLHLSLFAREALGSLSDKQKNALTDMDKHVERLVHIKDALLKIYYGSPDSFRERLKPEPIEPLIRGAADDVMPFVRQRNQNFSIEIDEGIPKAYLGPREIKQVLVNLLLNSIRYTPDNGSIKIKAKDDKDSIRVEVEDNGIGIPSDKLDTIFESFYEAQDTTRHSSGTVEFMSGGIGLGLTVARKIITDHKGRIWAESIPNGFTRLVFTIPKTAPEGPREAK